MVNLIKLELKKNQFRGDWLGVLIVNAVTLGIVAIVYFGGSSLDETIGRLQYAEAFHFIDTLVRASFIVYAAMLLARFVIEEYKNKTMALMFAYPINRKKLMAAKLIIVIVWTFLAIVLSNFIVSGALLLVNVFVGNIPGPLESGTLVRYVLQTLLNAAAAAGMSLIPLFFGMRRKSVPGTIVSAILVMAVLHSGVNGFSLYSYTAIPLTLAAIGIIIAYLSIRSVDKADLI